MITAQDIREKTFEKSRIGGYDMASVDDFLEELADDVTAYQKENAVLKSKMKVLVDKIEEYRANEEALNMAVLSAQKLAVQIENDARTRSAAMIEEAEQQVKARVGGIEAETEKQEKRLADAKAATEKFFEAARALCNTQLRNLDAISSGMTAATAAPAAAPASESADVDSAVRSIEESVSKLRPEPPVKMDLSSAMKPAAKPKKNFDSTQTFTL
ncbi:MAG: DivIVA domain-containing protein [Eubacteriales bacterium]|nr:DivIVA domain-containing protein [Eubacteriales bacterium]